MYFSGVALRTVNFTSGSQRTRWRGSWNARNRRLSGTRKRSALGGLERTAPPLADGAESLDPLVAHGHALRPPSRDLVLLDDVACDLGVRPGVRLHRVERLHPTLPGAAGAFLHDRVAPAGELRRSRWAAARVLVFAAGFGVRSCARRRCTTRPLLHAPANQALEILVGGHRMGPRVRPRARGPPAATPAASQARSRRIRECAPLCLAKGPGWAGPTRLGADQAPCSKSASSARRRQGTDIMLGNAPYTSCAFAMPLLLAGTLAAQDSTAARPLKWVAVPPILAPGAQIAVVSGDPTKPGPVTIELIMPDGYRMPPHSHPADEHVEVLQGTLLIGLATSWIPSGLCPPRWAARAPRRRRATLHRREGRDAGARDVHGAVHDHLRERLRGAPPTRLSDWLLTHHASIAGPGSTMSSQAGGRCSRRPASTSRKRRT